MCADYLFQQDKPYDVNYDTGDKVIQCGRHNDIFKLWLMWRSKVRWCSRCGWVVEREGGVREGGRGSEGEMRGVGRREVKGGGEREGREVNGGGREGQRGERWREKGRGGTGKREREAGREGQGNER